MNLRNVCSKSPSKDDLQVPARRQVRPKGSRSTSEAILQLRCVKYSDRWKDLAKKARCKTCSILSRRTSLVGCVNFTHEQEHHPNRRSLRELQRDGREQNGASAVADLCPAGIGPGFILA